MSIFISPLPCLVISVIGTVCAAMAAKEGTAEAKKFFILGILEIMFYIVGMILAIIMFITMLRQ